MGAEASEVRRRDSEYFRFDIEESQIRTFEHLGRCLAAPGRQRVLPPQASQRRGRSHSQTPVPLSARCRPPGRGAVGGRVTKRAIMKSASAGAADRFGIREDLQWLYAKLSAPQPGLFTEYVVTPFLRGTFPTGAFDPSILWRGTLLALSKALKTGSCPVARRCSTR